MTADACATPGCGHPKVSHGTEGCAARRGGRQLAKERACTCTAYLPPRPVPEEDPEASYNVCKCGHREGWHNTPYRPNCTGSFGECPCFVFEFDHAWPPATVPAPHAEAEAAEVAEEAEVWHQWVLDEEPALPPEWWDITRRAVAAGFKAGRGRGDHG